MNLAKSCCVVALLVITPAVLSGCGEVDVKIEINPTDAAGIQRESSVDIDFAIDDGSGPPYGGDPALLLSRLRLNHSR